MEERIWPRNSDASLVLRTDFAHPQEWLRMKAAIAEPQTPDGFLATVEVVDDRKFEGFTPSRLLDTVPADDRHAVAFLVDTLALTHPELPILAINLGDYEEDPTDPGTGPQLGATFRVIPSELWSVQNNLALANMDWQEFADATDHDGTFRGFP
ncbi:DUF6924 domain-containing protein [Actinoplanes sp. RD1]|uniref:DUF6924 domain-containing protein n=1 Tax=Actinoplanes sp. RD1 TaxID=3064538 RepID=UPI002740D60C|nr:hypothetical protein [Actinoplanes sp. RD1]